MQINYWQNDIIIVIINKERKMPMGPIKCGGVLSIRKLHAPPKIRITKFG
jgi:hypothetical protein